MEKIRQHNRELIRSAEYRASQMKIWPSPLEKKMIGFLDSHHIVYECQKIFYIHADDGWIITYYIADFFIPGSNVIIEVDGKFHDKQKGYDKRRTKEIQQEYPNISVLRFKWKDFSDKTKMKELLDILS
jgi:very-short-patch-repair endonuclease